jgi:hypothetical protein
VVIVHAGPEAAIENLYTVGSKVDRAWLDHWGRYEAPPPQ